MQVERFSIVLYHGVVAVVFAQGSFTCACSNEHEPQALCAKVKQAARDAQVSKHLSKSDIEQIANALATLEEEQ
jgi:rRNA maturation endonuclease Nob1